MATEPQPITDKSQKVDASALTPSVVFVVDPDPAFRRLIKFFLEEAGCSVTFFDDGYSALDQIRLSQPTLLITEMILPHLDGLALCRLLKSDPVTSGVNILVYTVLDARARAVASGADAFMKKPIEKKRLIELVSSLRLNQTAEEDA
jgi:CheY-like chemotaxis protein